MKSRTSHTWTTLPDIGQFPIQTRESARANPNLPDYFHQTLNALDRENTDLYIGPQGNAMLWESYGTDVVPSRDDRLAGDITGRDKDTHREFGKFHYVMDVSLGAETWEVEKDGEVEKFDVEIMGTARIEAVAKIILDSNFDPKWPGPKFLSKNIARLNSYARNEARQPGALKWKIEIADAFDNLPEFTATAHGTE